MGLLSAPLSTTPISGPNPCIVPAGFFERASQNPHPETQGTRHPVAAPLGHPPSGAPARATSAPVPPPTEWTPARAFLILCRLMNGSQPPPEPPASSTSPLDPQPPTANRSVAEVEYRSLTAYFEKLVKYTYGAIAVILAVAGLSLWRSTSDIKTDAAAAIIATKESANQQIMKIGAEAASTAQSAAQKAIDQVLEKPNIKQLIERTTQEKVGSAVEREIETKLAVRIDAFRTLIAEIGEISNHGAQLRLGFRSGLDYLVKKTSSPDATVREYAKSTLRLIGADYEQSLKGIVVPGGVTAVVMFGGIGMAEAAKTPKGLMGIIHNAESAQLIAAAFIELKKITGMPVQVFDIPAAERWCAENRPKCD
jgi:hypothetical protein